MSSASEIALALSERAATITVENGFATDVGTTVFRGKRRLADEDLPCIVLFEGPDRVEDKSTKHVKLAQRYTLEAHHACDPDNPNDRAHELISDMKRAIFAGDRTLGRTVKSIDYAGRAIGTREDGASFVFASIDFEVVFSEDLTDP
jgi:hypothetical protein